MKKQEIDFVKNPFATWNGDDSISKKLRHRTKVVKNFTEIKGKILDMGFPDEFGRRLGAQDNTYPTDFADGVKAPDKNYDTILCFEVLEHQMNMLSFVRDLYGLLKKDGKLILSTPKFVRFGGFYDADRHVGEYKRESLEILFKYAGFKMVKYRTFCYWDWDFMFWGIRPLIRVLFHRTQLWELKK